MSIRIVHEDGLDCPMVFCDHCGERIRGTGNYEWEWGADGRPTSGDIFFTHKQCSWAFEHARGGRGRWGTMELYGLLVYLANNVGMNDRAWREARRSARSIP